jgi:hypothetical protein
MLRHIKCPIGLVDITSTSLGQASGVMGARQIVGFFLLKLGRYLLPHRMDSMGLLVVERTENREKR